MRKCKHGARNHPLYGIWRQMIQRCTLKTNSAYKDYGGRGITVCEEWLSSPWKFFDDVGERPSAAHTIERTRNNEGYKPNNVTWATRAKQNENRRTSRWITVNGRTMLLRDWAKELGCTAEAIAARIKGGMCETEAVTKPISAVKRRAGATK